MRTANISLVVSARVQSGEDLDYDLVDKMKAAMLPVLLRHGYDIPGVADLCAVAALRAVLRESVVVTPCVVLADEKLDGSAERTVADCDAVFRRGRSGPRDEPMRG